MLIRWLLLTVCVSPLLAEEGETSLDVEMDNGVYILTEKNFDNFLKQHPTTLVKFYAPWCGHCKNMAPAYEDAASESQTPLAKVDATVETELGKKFGIQGFPTLKFFKEGESEPLDYDGPRDKEGIVDWLAQKTDVNYKPPVSEVVVLSKDNFDSFIGENELTLVKFYAPWCGHCKKMAPDYEKAARLLKAQGYKIKLGKVDSTVEKEISEMYGVTGYPTLKVFRNGRRADYEGPRDAEGIAKHMVKLSQPAAKELANLKMVDRFMDKMDVTIIAFVDKQDDIREYMDAAEKLRDVFNLGYTTDEAAFKKYDAKPGDMIIFYPSVFHSKFEPKSRTYNKPGASAEDMIVFIKDHSTPLVGKLTKKNYASRYSKLPLVVVYYNADFSIQYIEGSEFWRQKVLPLANKYLKDKYQFAVADEEEFAKELDELNLGDSGLEHNVVAFGFDGKKYPMNPEEFDGDLVENLELFMKKLGRGEVKPFVKSQPIPKNDKGPVKTLVGGNFDKVVDGSKDALIEFYAPWCGHCKKFEPEYVKLATSLKSETNLVIAKMDATANDPPLAYKVEGFPTIYFIPAGTETPLKYEGNRDLADLKKFMAKHATKSFQKTEL